MVGFVCEFIRHYNFDTYLCSKSKLHIQNSNSLLMSLWRHFVVILYVQFYEYNYIYI